MMDMYLQRKRDLIQMEADGLLDDDPLETEADDAAVKIAKGEGINAEELTSASTQAQGKTEEEATVLENTISPQLESSKGGGQVLEDEVKGEMEEKMNTDLSDINIHTDANAHKMSENINAKAFTHGQDIYFKDGNYNPNSEEGKELLAHELAHTQQQGKEKPIIKRQPTETTKVRDFGEQQHAEGVFHGDTSEGGYIIVPDKFPLTEEYYQSNPAEKERMDKLNPGSEHLYDTFWSLAKRFRISLEALVNANPDLDPERLSAGTKIIIPFVEEIQRIVPRPVTSIPVKQPDLKIKLPGNEKGPVVIPDTGYYTSYKEKVDYDETDVENAAYKILNSDPKIKDAMIFLGKIKTTNPSGTRAEWEAELEKFLTGDRKPDMKVKRYKFQGGTPDSNKDMAKTHQKMFINKKNEFSVSVSTYLHEMNHYIDTWYNSVAAKIAKTHRSESEMKSGIKPVEAQDITEEQQRQALPEYLNALVDQLINGMQTTKTQPNEHWMVPELRKSYKKWKRHPRGQSKSDFIKEKRKYIMDKMTAPEAYSRWGITQKSGKFDKSKGVEQGYAFEKAAYGFVELSKQQGVDVQKWSGNFNENFEKRFWRYLQ